MKHTLANKTLSQELPDSDEELVQQILVWFQQISLAYPHITTYPAPNPNDVASHRESAR